MRAIYQSKIGLQLIDKGTSFSCKITLESPKSILSYLSLSAVHTFPGTCLLIPCTNPPCNNSGIIHHTSLSRSKNMVLNTWKVQHQHENCGYILLLIAVLQFMIDNLDAGAKELLISISEKRGRKMNSAESANDIPKFVEFFKVLHSWLTNK